MTADMMTSMRERWETVSSIEAEQAVVGKLILDGRQYHLIGHRLLPEHFAHNDCRTIYEAIASLSETNSPIDLVTINDRCGKAYEKHTGQSLFGFMTELIRNTPGSSHIERYADIIIDKAMRRGLLVLEGEIYPAIKNAPTAQDAVSEVRTRLDALSSQTKQDTQTVDQTVSEWVREMQRRMDNAGALQGIDTGFNLLNERWGGLCGPDLIIVAGRPSMGKTALGMNIADNVAAQGKSVLVFSLEMSASQLTDRRMSSLTGIPLKKIRQCDLSEEEWGQISEGGALIRQRNLQINERGGVTIDYVRLVSTAHKARHGLDVLVVDYLQLLSKPGAENRVQEVGLISAGLKNIAKELHIPVIAISQLNRQCEARADKRPTMADLREAGNIEQDADIIAFVYRHERYEPENAKWKGIAEVITAKNRNGEVGTDFLGCELHLSRFKNIDPSYFPAPDEKKSGQAKGSRSKHWSEGDL